MGDTAGPLFDQAGHIRELEAEIARLHEHEKIRAQTIAEHQSRLIAADAAIAERDDLTARLERAEKIIEAMQPVVDAATVFVTEDDPTSAQIDALAKAVDLMPWVAHPEPAVKPPTT